MATKELRRYFLLFFSLVLLVLIFFIVRLYEVRPILDSINHSIPGSKTPPRPGKQLGHPAAGYVDGRYHEIYSVSTSDKKYFPIEFDRQHSINPNAIPHPFLDDTWIIVSQQQRSNVKDTVWCAELVCNAVFKNGALSCIEPPMILPISNTPGGTKCREELSFLQFNVGPHDARVFYGPSVPYVVFGSASIYTCFGQWILDFRLLMDWGRELFGRKKFRIPTELQRPEPYRLVEKNFFVFWDKNEDIYAHYNIAPKRVFAKLSYDGSTGPNLAPRVAERDAKCMAKYMPKVDPDHESIHQATNSLSLTLCKRADPSCKPDDSNTFIITIFHYKKFYAFHGVYEPYVMLFQQNMPFAIHGISTKPFWISGRGKPGEWESEVRKGSDQTQMFYVTSISWKKHGQKYHGYIDDVMFILFGIEDENTGGIDVVAGDLLAGLGLCES